MTNQVDQFEDGQFEDNQVAKKSALLLPQLSKRLKTGLHGIEPGFESLGNTLSAVYDDSEELTKSIKSSVSHIHADSRTGLLYDVENIVTRVLSVLSHCRTFIFESLEDIVACSEYLARLGLICNTMKENSDTLHELGRTLQVECRQSRVATIMFKDFGNEIKALAAKLDEAISEIYLNTQKIQDGQASMQSRISQSMKSFDQSAISAREAVENANEEILSIGRQAAMTLEKAGDHSLKISGIVGEIVMAIQFHDIARQQIEHIISGMEDISYIIKGLAPGNDGEQGSDGWKKGTAYFILSIQASQLKQVNTEANRMYNNIETAFEQISEYVVQLISDIAGSGSKEQSGIDMETGFRSFRSNMENLCRILINGDELGYAIRKSMQDASSAVATLLQFTDVVSDINTNLQYKALNAMSMTEKLGSEGAALGVFFRNIRDISTDSNAHVLDVVSIIKFITGVSKKVSAILDGPLRDGLVKSGSDMPENDCTGHIATVFDEYNQKCVKAATIARDMVITIGETKQHLGFFPRWINECEQILESVESLLHELSPWKQLAVNLPPGAKDDIAKRYTMESERRIHQALSRQDDIFENSDIAPDEGGKEDDSQDNVELF